MGFEGEDREPFPAVTTTVADGLGTTCADDPHLEFTVSEAAAGREHFRSTVDTLADRADATVDFPVDGLGVERTVQWEPAETCSEGAEGDREPAQAIETAKAKAKARPDVVPGFEILSELGRGGMGVVYKARQLRLNRLVALKMIRDDRLGNPENLVRFAIEAEAVARLNHPNIVQIFQFGKTGDIPFVALELLEGGTLARRLSGAPQPIRDAVVLVALLSKAVSAAHAAGIIHRDLKPSNVLFDGENVPKIADFGLAKRLEVEEGETRHGQVIGTPGYMAPEQAQGWNAEIGPTADVYSLGAILYEMLTGRPPHKGVTSAETIQLVLAEEPPSPSRLRSKIPFDLETICLTSLAREPHKRYANALGLADDLDRFLTGQPIQARRTPLWERALKLARRRPVTTLLLLLGLVVAGASVVVVQRAGDRARSAARVENERIARLRLKADQALFENQGALGEKRWNDVKAALTGLQGQIQLEPRLRDLHAKAENLIKQANGGLQADREAEQAWQEVEKVRARFQRFVAGRDEALFNDTRFPDFQPTNQVEATIQHARAALKEFGTAAPGDVWTLGPLPGALSTAEKGEVSAGFYQLLLILADAVFESPSDVSAARADRALLIIDQAPRVRSGASRAYHLRRSIYLKARGDDDLADRERAEAGKLAPADAFDSFLLGRELSKRSDWASAVRYFEEATQRQPDHFWAHCLLAVGHLQTNQPSEARLSLNTCLQRKPDDVRLYLLRGLANAGAAHAARELARRYPRPAADLEKAATEQFEAAEADYRKALGLLHPGSRDDELRYVLLVNRGVIRLERDELSAAAEDLQEAERLDKGRFEAFNDLGQVYRRQGRADDAREQFGRAIALRPALAALYRSRADVLLDLKERSPKEREAALRDLDAAARLEPPGSAVVAIDRTRQAALLHEAKRFDEALLACDAALETAPRYFPAHRLRIDLLLALKRYDDLIRSCDVALASTKPTAELYDLRATARYDLNKFSAAVADYTLALSLDPQNPRLLCRRGWSYLAVDALRPALDDFDAAVRLSPSTADAYCGRGFARARLGRHRAAVLDAEESLRRGDHGWRTAYKAARVYSQAISSAALEARKTGPDAVAIVSRYQARALSLIRQALDALPPDRRSSVFHHSILPDPALEPIKRRLRVFE